ncbi:uncharacterized protein LOC114256109 [Camellia sinensis]|uniref:uncharacterized protein LOC114256109 n=1 Tax=Camellia sinensis TaxID=4442 RepID=UPI001036DD16|nr:uncharacterized protein LOC114256109 [Camellia sinensis]
MSRKTAKDMRWHSDKRVDDGVGRHPADCKEWKEFDLHYPEFAQETCNVRLGLATDGFNPFGNMSTSYSMWPAILMPYNLPPWRCMKAPFFMMSLLIPGPNQPGTDIDVYLRPLIDELKELWENGVMTYDASTEQTFRMHAAVMWTINDFPAYGDLSGWRTKRYLSCPPCNDNPLSRGLISKIGWVGHRAYLPDNHLWRKDKKFDGLTELRKKSLDLPVEKVMAQLDQLREVKFGKDPTNKKRPRESEELNWTKKSIMWELPYWKKLNLRHNLDVMHIEKNICENFYGTMLAIDGKNKDTYKARDDLQEMGIRQELHLQRKDNGSVVKPRAAYTLDSRQIDGFCEFLKSISYPDGYAANISRCVTSKNGRLSGMKSHDCHVLLQRLLPIGMRGFVNKEICTTLFELGNFFQELCSKTLRQTDLEKMEERIVLILCKLEKNFPPAFFDVMVHLAVHLPREAMFAGPVQYRWMYPIERFLGTLKGYISNRARPEGSIAELKGIDKPEQNDDGGERGPAMEMNDLRTKGSPKATDELWSLANGPGSVIDFYSGCIYNGIRFHTRNCENRRTCQNSGLVIEGDHNGNQINFYGYLCKIWELKYLHGGTVVLFQCEWYDTGHKNRIYSDEHVTSIDVTRLWYKDDQFILPSQDIPERDDVSNDAFQQDETTDGVGVVIQDNDVQYSRGDMDPEIIFNDQLMAENLVHNDDEDNTIIEYNDDEDDELHRQPDVDVDPDIDLDIDYDM